MLLAGFLWARETGYHKLAYPLLGVGLLALAAFVVAIGVRQRGLNSSTQTELRAATKHRLAALGYQVLEVPGGLLLARRPWEALLVQVMSDGRQSCGVGLVRDLHGQMAANSANGCIVVTAGRFTAGARKFASGRPIWLWDLGELSTDPLKNAPRELGRPPDCFVCGAPMRVREARTAEGPGRRFLGCSRWPHCKATRSLPKDLEVPVEE